MIDEPTDDPLDALLGDLDAARASIAAVHRRLAESGRLARVLLVEYRCARRCLLLHVWRSPRGMLYRQPGYRLSPERVESDTDPAARAARSTDGGRQWPERAGTLDFYRGLADAGLTLACSHVEHFVAGSALLADADAARPGRPVRRRVGSEPA